MRNRKADKGPAEALKPPSKKTAHRTNSPVDLCGPPQRRGLLPHRLMKRRIRVRPLLRWLQLTKPQPKRL
ncbi:hypothetical protein GUJ93_ZPchr0009g232 [Zizania palustris]|uniref:Uncharacterized protein n=1 Tax=Zizania palustris TaxID=103762 RepID=A0A8J5R128_ZIZPA|nr:hypothetical protein GUJ93_ZPchr0009g232 [Zizania palustris]